MNIKRAFRLIFMGVPFLIASPLMCLIVWLMGDTDEVIEFFECLADMVWNGSEGM